MRGSNNQMNQPRFPGPNMAGGVSRGPSDNFAAILIQEQQRMLLQQQQEQFLARQQIIQVQQLQKQRLLRQQEDQNKAILQQQTMQHHQQQQQQQQLLLQQRQQQQQQHLLSQSPRLPQPFQQPQNLPQVSRHLNEQSGLAQGGHLLDTSRPPPPIVQGRQGGSHTKGPTCGPFPGSRSGQSQPSGQQRSQFRSSFRTRSDEGQRNNDRASGSQSSLTGRGFPNRPGSFQHQRSAAGTGASVSTRLSSSSSRDCERRLGGETRQSDFGNRNSHRNSEKYRGRDTTRREERDRGRNDSRDCHRGRESRDESREGSSCSSSSARLPSPESRSRESSRGRDLSRGSSQSQRSIRSDSGRGSLHRDRENLRESRDSSMSSPARKKNDFSKPREGSPTRRQADDAKFVSPSRSRYQRDGERDRSQSRSRRSPVGRGRDSSQSRQSSSYSRSPSRELSPPRKRRELSQHRSDILSSDPKQEESLSSQYPEFRYFPPSEFQGAGDEMKLEVEEEEVESITTYFTCCCPADLYFTRNSDSGNMEATQRMIELETKFEEEMTKRLQLKTDSGLEASDLSQPNATHQHHHHHNHHHHHHHHHHRQTCCGAKKSSISSSSSSSSSDDDDDDDDDDGGVNQIMEEWDKRKKHPQSLHPELWFNLRGQANDGPLCRCSIKSRQSGIRHDIYPGEKAIPLCDPESNNLGSLYHYRMTMSPCTNFLTKVPTIIHHDNHEFIFEGFSMFSHVPLENIPSCKLLRFNIEYTIGFVSEAAPQNFTIRSLNIFNKFIFTEILELVNLDWKGPKDPETGSEGCNCFHFMPRFCRTLPDSGCKEALSMNTVLGFLLRSLTPLVAEDRVDEIMTCGESEWHAKVDPLRGMIVTKPGMRPAAIRIDQLDRKVTTPTVKLNDSSSDGEKDKADRDKKRSEWKKEKPSENYKERDAEKGPRFPLIIHQGNRPAQLSYAGDPVYRKAWKQYVKYRHLLNSKPKVDTSDKAKLKDQEERLREIRMKKTMKREVTVELSSQGFLATGLRGDLCQHALMVPVLMSHLRFHICLGVLEDTLQYKFKDRNLLQLCLTHTSYRTNYGTNPDHTRNSLTNCGMRQVDFGDRRIHYQNTRKRGICILVDIMSRMGKQEETTSEIPHNERLEFLGDAVIEFLSSVHLFYMFPWLDEGGLTTYRMALVQNQHLAVLAKKLKLQDFMLYVHGPDLCHESDLRHAMANCCEAIMGALFLDGGIEVADAIFARALFDDDEILLKTWTNIPKHVLQHEEPGGDRHWIKSSPVLQKLEQFEESLGIKFTHIRLLAKAFTHRNMGMNPLTRGHNQRLEFLGDTVLQLVASEYLYWHYPEHHEGHLSLLRSSLVNSRTQSMVHDDLDMSKYVIFNACNDRLDMKTKQRADILEAFVGALFVDKDLDYCRTFCNVCFFPRLKDFIINQDWNDPKSQLQQCCLTLREVGGGEPDIPVYKVIESIGPTNTRKYVVAVYFRGKRLARGSGHNIQQAEMSAANQALKKRAELFPILQHQRRFLERIQKDQAKAGRQRNGSGDGDDGDSDNNREGEPALKKKKKPRVKRRRPGPGTMGPARGRF